MPSEPGHARSAELQAAFAERGAVVVPGLLDRSWCERLQRAIERCQASPSQFYGVLSPPGEPKVDSDLFRWFDDPDIAEATHASPLPALGAELCGADAAVLIEDQWFCSEPGAVSRSPWHQDHPYYNLDRPFATIWVTLDDVTADAALRVVEGSHATGITYAPIEFSSSISTTSRPATRWPSTPGCSTRHPRGSRPSLPSAVGLRPPRYPLPRPGRAGRSVLADAAPRAEHRRPGGRRGLPPHSALARPNALSGTSVPEDWQATARELPSHHVGPEGRRRGGHRLTDAALHRRTRGGRRPIRRPSRSPARSGARNALR